MGHWCWRYFQWHVFNMMTELDIAHIYWLWFWLFQARIKAKPLLHSTFVPKNGFKQQQPAQTFDPNLYNQNNMAGAGVAAPSPTTPTQQPSQPQRSNSTGSSGGGSVTGASSSNSGQGGSGGGANSPYSYPQVTNATQYITLGQQVWEQKDNFTPCYTMVYFFFLFLPYTQGVNWI